MVPLLQGVKVIEVGAVVLGPYVGQMLADMGAEIIKVEALEGDIARYAHPQGAGGGSLFLSNNRNKRMLAIDLKRPEGQAAIAKLIERSDVFFHNMRADAAERLGIGFDAVAAIKPDIIYCAAIGFGQRGRYRDRPAFDDIIQAASGLAGLSAMKDGEPQFMPTIIADKVAALHALYAILAALVARARGQAGPISIEAPMFEVMTSFLLNEHLAGAAFAEDGLVGYPRLLSPDRRPHRTADGWIAVLPYTKDQWQRFLGEIGRAELCEEEWFRNPNTRQAHIGQLYQLLSASLAGRTTDAWIEALSALDIPCSRIATPAELLDDPHLAEIGFFDVPEGYPEGIVRSLPQPVLFDGIAPLPDTAPRALGADSRAILADCGYDDAEIAALIDAGVIRTAGKD